MGTTPNYGWIYPTVGADLDDWGDILNTMFGDIDTDLKAVSDAAVAAAAAASAAAPVGQLGFFLSSTAPTGWIKGDGGTIGNASSGGTTRANADTANLFALYWALDATDFPIFTSAGAGSTRGASAAADFAANKRILIEDFRSEYVRGYDDGRGINTQNIGAWKDGQMPSHTHTIGTSFNFGNGGQPGIQPGGGGLSSGATGGTTNSSENRVRAITRLVCIKL